MKIKLCLCGLGLAFAGFTTQALAVTIVDLGYNAPPATLGGYTMVPVPDDTGVIGATVGGAPLSSGTIAFSPSIEHFAIGDGWGTWSTQPGHSYTGDVYSLIGDALTITLPNSLSAFYVYVEPALFTSWSYTISSNGQSITLDIEGDPTAPGGGGAYGFGFFVGAGESIPAINIVDNTGLELGFAVGEFGEVGTSGVPESSSVALLAALGFAALVGCRRAVARS